MFYTRPALLLGCLTSLSLLLACAEADNTQGGSKVNTNTNQTTSTSTSTSTSTGTAGPGCMNECADEDILCQGDMLQRCVTNAAGCKVWQTATDCASQNQKCEVSSGQCVALSPSCTDGSKGEEETDVDCGGPCARCEEGKTCQTPLDCASETCEQSVCVKKPTEGMCTNEGAKQCGATGVQTCQGGTWVETEACANGCKNLVCEPNNNMCTEGQSTCDGNTPQTCVMGKLVPSQPCPQGCDMGTCVQKVSCTANESRCLGPIVQRCNATGTAWTFDTLCQDRCENSLCVGTCTPDEVRCNGNQRETCQQDGKTWSSTETCANGCDQGVCIANGYTNSGIKETKQGVEVVTGCWTIELGGEVEVPGGETLEVFADCVKITDSGKLTLRSGAKVKFHAETIELDGFLDGGREYVFRATKSLSFNGRIKAAAKLFLWADTLTIGAQATLEIVSAFYALYGKSIQNDLVAEDANVTVSVMPPFELNSSTHPSGFTWNWSGDDVSISWDKPFPGATGYYVTLGRDNLPTPANGSFTNTESIALPAQLFHQGSNVVNVIGVNQDNTLGVYSQQFVIPMNNLPPVITSSSHPDPKAWNPTDDVFMSWTEPEGILPGSWIGYAWAWSDKGGARVDLRSSMLSIEEQKLFPDQPKGERHFHIVALDRLGRPSAKTGRYTTRVGDEPETTNLAGEVLDAVTKEPLSNATVSVEEHVQDTITQDTGAFTFLGELYVRQTPYSVTFSAPGYVAQTLDITLNSTTTVTKTVELQPKASIEDRYVLGPDIDLQNLGTRVVMGPNNTVASMTDKQIRSDSLRNGTFGNTSAVQFPNKILDVQWVKDQIWSVHMKNGMFWSTLFDVILGQGTKEASTRVTRSRGLSNASSLVTDTALVSIFNKRDQDCGFNISRCEYTLELVISQHDLRPFGSTSSSLRTREVTTRQSYAQSFVPYPPQGLTWNDTSNTIVIFTSDSSPKMTAFEYDLSGVQRSVKYQPRVAVNQAEPIHAIFDGTSYHVSAKIGIDQYIHRFDSSLTRQISEKLPGDASIAYDGEHLLVVYEGALETRDPDDYSVIHTQKLPDTYKTPKLSRYKETGQMILSYEKPNKRIAVRELIAK